MSDSEKLAAFFKADKSFDRIMKELLKKFEKYGEVKGTVTINNASINECEAANSIINPKSAFDPPFLRFKVADFERGIKGSRYKESELKNVLEAYFNTVIVTNKDKKLMKEQAKKEFFNSIICAHIGSSSEKWLKAMPDECKYGYIIVIREFEYSDLNARNMLDNICKAVDSRIEYYYEPVQLAVLSANITGNSHYFDSNTVAGKLLIHALAYLADIKEYKNAEEIKAVYELGLKSVRTNSKKEYIKEKRKKNILKQQFNVDAPNKVWVSDVTVFSYGDYYYYICAIIDLFSRKVVAYHISKHNSTQLVKTTMKRAITSRKPEYVAPK